MKITFFRGLKVACEFAFSACESFLDLKMYRTKLSFRVKM